MSQPSRFSPRAKKREPGTAKPRTAVGVAGGILGLVGMSAVAGVLATAAIAPAVALTGVGASTTISVFENLPEVLDINDLAQPSTMYAKQPDGSWSAFATFYYQNRVEVGWDQVSQFAKDAAVAVEDPRFYEHGGVDLMSTMRAIVQNQIGSNVSGASTITMQYVRNVLIQKAEQLKLTDEAAGELAYEDATRTDVDRKLKEMKLAIGVEKKYSKDDILMGYLNIALFGGTIYGIEAAANYYYNTTAANLTLEQAASLVATVNNPSVYRIDIPENIPANQERRDRIIGDMLETGKITQEQYDAAIAVPVTPAITQKRNGCDAAQEASLGFFCDYVQRYLLLDEQFGATPEEREIKLRTGGLQIYTTINLQMQAAGQAATDQWVPQTDPRVDIGSSTVSVEVGTGKVLTMVQNKKYSANPEVLAADASYSAVNYNTDFDYGGSTGFQPGSTYKTVVLAEWIRQGRSVNDVVDARGRTVQMNTFRDRCQGGTLGGPAWQFSNDSAGGSATLTVKRGTELSTNGVFVSMAQRLDMCDIGEMAASLGIHRANGEPLQQNPATVLGTNEVAPISMATAFAAYAGGGIVCDPVPIESITDEAGTAVPFTTGNCRQGIEPRVASGVAYTLQSTVANGLARHAASAIGVPHLAKTGTTDDVVDNWTVGASTKVATATWTGNVTGKNSLYRLWANGGLLYQADMNIWPAVMDIADAQYGGDAFPSPDSSVLTAKTTPVPDVRGKTYEEAVQLLEGVGFTPVDGGDTDSDLPAGTVAGTSPPAGSAVTAGSAISIQKSSANLFAVPDTTGQNRAQATGTLQGQGWTVSTAKVCANGSAYPSGTDDLTVSRTEPAATTLTKREGQITLIMNCPTGG